MPYELTQRGREVMSRIPAMTVAEYQARLYLQAKEAREAEELTTSQATEQRKRDSARMTGLAAKVGGLEKDIARLRHAQKGRV